MQTYKDMYLRLFNRVTDAMDGMEAGDMDAAYEILRKAQLETEEMYISGADEDPER